MATRTIASTSTNYTIGDLLYASSTTQLSTLAIGSTGNLLATKSGVPAWVGGSSASPTSYTAGTPLISIYATSSNTTSTNAEPFYLKSVMTGIGGYGGRARFHSYTNVALGTNFMALKAQCCRWWVVLSPRIGICRWWNKHEPCFSWLDIHE